MNHKTLTGREVIAIDSGRKLGTIERILFDPKAMKIAAIVIHPAIHSVLEEPEPMRQVAVEHIRGLGQDVVTVQNEEALQPVAEGGSTSSLVAFDQIENESVMTEGGNKVGDVSDVEFDERTMELVSIQLGHGFLARKSSIPVSEIISVGEDVIVVRESAEHAAEDVDAEQRDGIPGAPI